MPNRPRHPNLVHGVRTFTETGNTPSVYGHRRIRKELKAIRARLESETPNMTERKAALIQQIMRAETIMTLAAEYMKRNAAPLTLVQTMISAMSAERMAILALAALDREDGKASAARPPFEIIEDTKKTEGRFWNGWMTPGFSSGFLVRTRRHGTGGRRIFGRCSVFQSRTMKWRSFGNRRDGKRRRRTRSRNRSSFPAGGPGNRAWPP